MVNLSDFWNILSIIGTLTGVITALCLSIIPPFVYRKKRQNESKNRIINTFKIIDNFFEEYRYFYVTHEIINGIAYRRFDPDKVKMNININNLIDPLLNDIKTSKFKNKKELFNIYYLTYNIFSGWPVSIIKWYELEAKICIFFNLPYSHKKYFKYKSSKNEKDLVYNCICCSSHYYNKGNSINFDELTDNEKEINNIFNTEFCKKHRIPMHLD